MEKKKMNLLETPAKIFRSKSSVELSDEKTKAIPRSKSAAACLSSAASSSERQSRPVGIPPLSKSKSKSKTAVKLTVEELERDLTCCKLQIAMSIVKLKYLQKQLRATLKFNQTVKVVPSDSVKHSLRSSYAAAGESSVKKTEEDEEKQILDCKEYIQKKQVDFLRLRPLWRELKKKRDDDSSMEKANSMPLAK